MQTLHFINKHCLFQPCYQCCYAMLFKLKYLNNYRMAVKIGTDTVSCSPGDEAI